MAHGDVGNTPVVDGNKLASARRHTKRMMHEEDALWDEMLHLKGAKRMHDMTMDTDNKLVVVGLFNNQLTCEDEKGTIDEEGRHMQ